MNTIGVIGLGWMGLRRLEYLAGMEGIRIGGVCTRNADVLAEQAGRFEVLLASPDWQDVLAADLDAVVVCTPNGSHAEIAIAALRAGKDVLVEYPMAVTLEEIDSLVAAADETGGLLHVGHTMRHEAQHVAVRERMDELGEPIEYRGVMALPEMWKWTGDPKVCGSFFALANYHLADQVVDWSGR
ncbi:MAG: Gfo/Idh/MocA family protein, partial [Planctomycetota bacterium]